MKYDAGHKSPASPPSQLSVQGMHDGRVLRGMPDPQGYAGIRQDLEVKTSQLSDKGTKVMEFLAYNSDDQSHIVEPTMSAFANISPINTLDSANSVINWWETRSSCHLKDIKDTTKKAPV